jgi:curved DNA-binding protein CbpA
MTDAPFDPYKVLQVDPEAEVEVIEAAFRRLARKYHPDVAADPDAQARMILINRAWELLGDQARRAEHDRVRTSGGEPATGRSAPPPSAGAPSAKTPEHRPERPPGVDLDRIIREEAARAARAQPGDTVSRDWGSGRSTVGGGYDPATMRTPDGSAGPPPGNPSGTVLRFGRYEGWSMGEIARTDIEYLEWLDRMPIGRPYRDEIDAILRRAGRRRSEAAEQQERRGLFRRR